MSCQYDDYGDSQGMENNEDEDEDEEEEEEEEGQQDDAAHNEEENGGFDDHEQNYPDSETVGSAFVAQVNSVFSKAKPANIKQELD